MKISKRKYAALMRVLRNLPARLHDECRYTPREAFASLIDKVSGRGTWKSNPWVFVYEFEPI